MSTLYKVPVLDNGNLIPTKFLRGGSVVLDFGTLPLATQSFTIVDSNVSSSSIVTGGLQTDPTTKDFDENEMDAIDIKLISGSGSFTCFVKGLEGYLHDKFLLSYVVQ